MFTNPKSGKWKEDGSLAKKTCLMIHNQEKAEQIVHLLKAFPEVEWTNYRKLSPDLYAQGVAHVFPHIPSINAIKIK